MSTRATYEINGITAYIHHDGYPQGASAYLYTALCFENKHGGLFHQFIRANDRAEVTESHEAWGDTQYRYTVTGNDAGASVEVQERVWGEGDKPCTWEVIFTGRLADFIAERTDFIEDFSGFQEVGEGYSRRWMNAEVASKEIRVILDQLKTWKENGHQGTRNYKQSQERLSELLGFFPEALAA